VTDPKLLPGGGEDAGDTFMSHLIELRTRLLRAGLAVLVVVVCLVPFSSDIYDLLAHPMMQALPEGTKMIAIGVTSPFAVPLKITAMLAFVIALPVVLYQAWAFVAPGLYSHEKRLAVPIVVSSYLLFLGGMAFTYFFIFGTVFRVIYKYSPKSVQVAPDIDSYLSFVLTMFLAFGLTFEVPVVVVVLVYFGIVSVAKLREWRPYMIVGAFGIAAVVTPPDPTSMLMLAVPLWLLYEAGIIVASFIKPRSESTAKA
jgi:sec-independent protein translocase protein TatC